MSSDKDETAEEINKKIELAFIECLEKFKLEDALHVLLCSILTNFCVLAEMLGSVTPLNLINTMEQMYREQSNLN